MSSFLLCCFVLLCSYANVKKCTNEGRALMQLDFQQFLMKLEKLTDLRPIPDKEFVETYIKAYYLTENDMEQFIKNHRVRLIIKFILSFCFASKFEQNLTLRGRMSVLLTAFLCFCAGVLHEAAS